MRPALAAVRFVDPPPPDAAETLAAVREELTAVRRRLEEAMEALAAVPLLAPAPAGLRRLAAADLRGYLRARRMRGRFFGLAPLADPSWDMLLDLYAADLEGDRVSVSSVCLAACAPPTTALRHLSQLEQLDLIKREADRHDRRRAWVTLSERGRAAMRDYLAAIGVAG